MVCNLNQVRASSIKKVEALIFNYPVICRSKDEALPDMTGVRGPGGEIFFDVRCPQSMPGALNLTHRNADIAAVSRTSFLTTVPPLSQPLDSLSAGNTLPMAFLTPWVYMRYNLIVATR